MSGLVGSRPSLPESRDGATAGIPRFGNGSRGACLRNPANFAQSYLGEERLTSVAFRGTPFVNHAAWRSARGADAGGSWDLIVDAQQSDGDGQHGGDSPV